MAHAIWSGAINFGLVTIPVKLFTAIRSSDLSFNMLHEKDEGRIKYERVCSVDGKEVPWDEIVKGYEFEKGQYVTLRDEDFDRVSPEITQTCNILEFVDLAHINPMFFDKPYYLEPTKTGRHAYALFREALASSNRVAIARVVMRSKEYIAAVKPIGEALVLQMMHWADEIVETSTLDLPTEEQLPQPEMKMAKMLIDTMTVEAFEPAKFKNVYREELMKIIDARIAGKELPMPAKKAVSREKVVNLMDVLAASLEEKKKEAGAAAPAAKTSTRRRKSSAA